MSATASNLAPQQPSVKRSTFQHDQGCMVNSLVEMNLESTYDFRVMTTIIKYWNKKKYIAFPSIETLSQTCNMSRTTIIKSLNSLTKQGLLVVVKTSGRTNKYHISNLLLDSTSTNTTMTPVQMLDWSCIEHTEEQIEKTSFTNVVKEKPSKNDDVSLKTSNNIESISDYKNVIVKLKRWNVYDAYKLIKCNGLAKIKQCIEITEYQKPKNAGGYFRSLLNITVLPSKNTSIKNDLGIKPLEGNLIVQQNSSSLMSNNSLEHCKKIQQINEPKPSRQEMIQNLINEGKTKEANELKKLWRIVS